MAFKREIEWQTNHMLLPFKSLCEQRKVHVDVVVIESDDVVTAVAEEVTKDALTKLVVGALSSGIFRSKHKGMHSNILYGLRCFKGKIVHTAIRHTS
ncbi:U-box domain-containing protein 35-like isoform X2 [Vicia villosa]|nr:U-box domain-containing protein 35-like isoform X2 [Vicia villosa]